MIDAGYRHGVRAGKWPRRSGTESSQTRCWSKADSNSGSHPRPTPPAATRFVADSALEGAGFEPSVPRQGVSVGGAIRW